MYVRYVVNLNQLKHFPTFFYFLCSVFSVFVRRYKIATLVLIMNRLVRLNIWRCDTSSIFITGFSIKNAQKIPYIKNIRDKKVVVTML